jgi:Tfp pilus assembly protein PilX
MRRRTAREDGWALLTAVMLMTIMATFGLATASMVDNQTKQSAAGRERETAFNLAEAALNAQIYSLTSHWPGKGGATSTSVAFPNSCTPTSNDARCPSPATLSAMFTSADTASGASWTTMVRDNSGVTGATTFWSESMTGISPAYDANGDGKIWVRSSAVAQGHTRTMVALVRTEQQGEVLPHNTVLAGRVSISNNGHKVIIDTRGTGATTSPVVVRCTPTPGESTACLGHPLGTASNSLSSLLSLLDIQIFPNSHTTGYTGNTALDAESLERLRQAAISDGTYYTYCPASLTGATVWIDTPTTCSYNSNATYNTAANPGVLIMAQGVLSIAGTVVFHGLIYHANQTNASGWLVQLNGNAEVDGGVVVDGGAGFIAGSSKTNVVFDDSAFQSVRSYGTAGVIQNTWRELTPSS